MNETLRITHASAVQPPYAVRSNEKANSTSDVLKTCETFTEAAAFARQYCSVHTATFTERIKIRVRQDSFSLKQPALEGNRDASFQHRESSGGGQSKEVWEVDNDPKLLEAITSMGVVYEIL